MSTINSHSQAFAAGQLYIDRMSHNEEAADRLQNAIYTFKTRRKEFKEKNLVKQAEIFAELGTQFTRLQNEYNQLKQKIDADPKSYGDANSDKLRALQIKKMSVEGLKNSKFSLSPDFITQRLKLVDEEIQKTHTLIQEKESFAKVQEDLTNVSEKLDQTLVYDFSGHQIVSAGAIKKRKNFQLRYATHSALNGVQFKYKALKADRNHFIWELKQLTREIANSEEDQKNIFYYLFSTALKARRLDTVKQLTQASSRDLELKLYKQATSPLTFVENGHLKQSAAFAAIDTLLDEINKKITSSKKSYPKSSPTAFEDDFSTSSSQVNEDFMEEEDDIIGEFSETSDDHFIWDNSSDQSRETEEAHTINQEKQDEIENEEEEKGFVFALPPKMEGKESRIAKGQDPVSSAKRDEIHSVPNVFSENKVPVSDTNQSLYSKKPTNFIERCLNIGKGAVNWLTSVFSGFFNLFKW